jgi:hypothetical protein
MLPNGVRSDEYALKLLINAAKRFRNKVRLREYDSKTLRNALKSFRNEL